LLNVLDQHLKNISLAPLGILPVLAIAYVFGRNPGMIAAVPAGISLGALEGGKAHEIAINCVLLILGYECTVLLLDYAYRASRERDVLAFDRNEAKVVHDHLFRCDTPDCKHWRFSVLHLPLRDVGGDFYSFQRVGDRVELFEADVSGKGLRAAMFLGIFKALLHERLDDSLASCLSRISEHLHSIWLNESTFATAWYGSFAEDGEIAYSVAGHEPALVCRKEGEIFQTRTGGIPLGLMPQSSYEIHAIRLEPGEAIAVHSDGLSELIAGGKVKQEELFEEISGLEQRLTEIPRRDDVLLVVARYENRPR
jgi:serine phosphatase RsbU (regulator of sigma subunit)